MDRKKLKEMICKEEEFNIENFYNKLSKVIKKGVEKSTDITQPGASQLVVVIEELSELQKEICKSLRNKTDIFGITEELADVYITLEYIKEIYNINTDELRSIMKIKIDKFEEQLDKNDK